MKTGTAEKILKESEISLSRPTLLKNIDELNLKIKKTISGENIFKWQHLSKIRYFYQYQENKIKPFVLSICQNKGGVAKTTSVINLSKVFSYIGKTLIIDLDSQSNLSQSFDVYSKSDDITLTDCLDNQKLTNKAIKNISENLDILPNNLKFERWKRTCRSIKDFELLLKNVIDKVKDQYKFIIIDTPPALDVSLELSLFASDFCIIPFEPHPFGLEGITNLLEEIEFISKNDKSGKINIKLLGVFFTLYEKGVLSDQIISTVVENYNTFDTKIRKTVAIQQAQAVKQTIFDYDEVSTGSTDYYNLAFEILKEITE